MTPEKTTLVWAAVATALIFMGLRLGFTFHLVPDDVAKRFADLDNRTDFSLVYLANFAATGYLIAWLVMAGAHSKNAVIRRISNALRFLFSLAFLRLIGRHSLQVYTWHVILIYLLKAIQYHHGPFNEWAKTVIALAAVASLAIPALYREREKFFGKADAKA